MTDLSVQQIADSLGISHQRVRTILNKTLERFRRQLEVSGIGRNEAKLYLADFDNRYCGYTVPGIEKKSASNRSAPGRPKGDCSRNPKGRVDRVPVGLFKPTWSNIETFGHGTQLIQED